MTAASLDEVLSTSQVIVVFAGVTSENQGFLGRREFERITPGSVVLLMSRAGVVDFPEFLAQIESGRFRAASDVYPIEPAPADDPARKVEGLLLSAASRRRARRFAVRDRPPDGRRRRIDPARPAAAVVPARPARDGGALAQQADREKLASSSIRLRRGEPDAPLDFLIHRDARRSITL